MEYFICEFVCFRGYEDHDFARNYTVVVLVNLNKKLLEKYFKQGSQKLGFDLISLGEGSRKDGLNVNSVVVDKNIELEKLLEKNDIPYEDDSVCLIFSLSNYVHLYMAIASYNKKLHYLLASQFNEPSLTQQKQNISIVGNYELRTTDQQSKKVKKK